ncbi:MAG: DUF3179 domain-containing protein [Candidatus Magasanikbacteria bacterium]
MKKTHIYGIVFVIIIIASILVFSFFKNKDINKPNLKKEAKIIKKSMTSTKVMKTNGAKHTVPLGEIMDGGPPKDGIPSIDSPKFVLAKNVDYLKDDTPGIAVSVDGVDKFYPYSILVWHEIVNDKINGQRILVTYCPLCRSGVVYDPKVKGERVEFGTSGKLWQSNLVMYDRKTDSLWSQVLGQSIKGEMAGKSLEKIPSTITTFGDWKEQYPNGKVLSEETGFSRDYDDSPYGKYHQTEATYFPTKSKDDRLDKKELIIGVVINGKAKAYQPPAVKKKGRVEDEFQGTTIVAEYDDSLNSLKLFKKEEGKLKRLPTISAYWFSWTAAYPNTKLYK